MKIAFVCDTPYQCLNATNLFWNFYRGREDIRCDIYVVDQFAKAAAITESLKNKKLFDNVYFLRREENRFMPQGLKRSLRVAYSYLNTKNAVRNQFDGEIPKNKYDLIYSSVMTCFVSALIVLNPKAEFCLYDDGTGSYSGDIVANGGGTAYKLFSKLTGRGANAARASKLYVNNPDMCNSTAAEEICRMPAFTQEYLDVAYEIFGVTKREGKMTGIVLLTYPALTPESDKDLQDIVDLMRPYSRQVLVRPHPRELGLERYEGFTVDTKGEMWELMISQMDMEQIALVGTYSTAQITPKLLYGKEPRLIFTYKLANSLSAETMSRFDVLVNEVCESYSNKDRIMVPKTVDELRECMDTILGQQVSP